MKIGGLLFVDYSSRQPGGRSGSHALTIDTRDFRSFLNDSEGLDFDVVCEIKDKEQSAHKALAVAGKMARVG